MSEVMPESSTVRQIKPFRLGEDTGRIFTENFRDQLTQLEIETLKTQNRESFQEYLSGLLEDHRPSWLKKALKKLKPYFDSLDRFSKALDMVFSADRFIALTWGIVRIIIQVGINAIERMERISDLLCEVGGILDRLLRTEKIFPNHEKLRNALEIAHGKIMKFHLEIIIYLRKPPWWKRFAMSFRGLQTIKDHIEKIRLSAKDVKAETRFAELEYTHLQNNSQRIFNVPYSWNHNFFSREAILKRIDACFESPANPTVVCLHGMSGVGKSTITLEYTHTRISKFDWIIWVHADTEEKLCSSFREIANRFKLTAAGLSEKDLISAVKGHLSSATQSWLLVFDNGDDLNLLKHYWPLSGNGNIILTTQDYGPSTQFSSERIHIDKLSLEEGIQFLKSFVPEIDPENDLVKQLVLEVGALPIALHHVARRLKTAGPAISIKEILEQYRDPARTQVLFEADEGIPWSQRAVIGRVWEPAYRKLKATNEKAAYILKCLAWVDHDGLPENILQNQIMFPEMSQRVNTHSLAMNLPKEIPPSYHVAIEALIRSSLVTRSSECLWVHRLVQLTTINRMKPDERIETFCFTVELIAAKFPKPYYNPQEAVFPGDMGNTEVCQTLIPHVLSLAKNYKKYFPDQVTERFGSLMQRAAFYLLEIDNQQGEELLRLSLKMNWTGERPILAHIQMSLAWNLMRRGKLRQAREFGSQSIGNFESSIGDRHVLTGWAYCNFGRILAFMAKFSQAHEYHLKAIDIYKRRVEDDPTNSELRHGLMMARNYLATLLHCRHRGDIMGDIYEPSVVGDLGWIVPILTDEQRSNLEEPLQHCKAGLELSKPIYTSRLKSQTLAWIELSLGWLLLDLGRISEAEKHNSQALVDIKVKWDSEGCGVGVLTVQRADILNAQGKTEDAEEEYKKAHRLLEKRMGPENPLTALSYHKTGNFYCRSGRYRDAVPYYRLALKSFIGSYGEQNPSTATTMNNLGVALINIDKRSEGIILLNRAKEARMSCLGSSHQLVRNLTTNINRLKSYPVITLDLEVTLRA